MLPMRKTFLFLAVSVLFTGTLAAQQKKLDPCTLVSKADVQEATGTTVTGPKANPSNATVCDFKAGDMGAVGFTAQPAGPGQTADRVMAELQKMKIAVAETKGVGDRAFFSSPGYGMTQLNAFKGKNYIIVTLMIPGTAEAKQKEIASKLMQIALSKL